MNILFVSNYYYPYISGMTEYLRLVAEGLANEMDVTVLTSQYDQSLPREERINGVRIRRSPVVAKLSKGVISPRLFLDFTEEQRHADVVNLHLPMVESGVLAHLVPREKLVVTYQCDVSLPGLLGKVVERVMDASCFMALRRANSIVVTSLDYAEHSRVVRSFIGKTKAPSPPIKIEEGSVPGTAGKPIVGFLGRVVAEKGLDVLLKAVPQVLERVPDCEFLIAGAYEGIAGGSIYDQLKRDIGWDERHVRFLGKLTEVGLHEFYNSLSLFVLPSVNSLEAFGLVQVEAMLHGVPVVASDIPGVRQVVSRTGMGLLVPPRDSRQLADAIAEILTDRTRYVRSVQHVESIYSLERSLDGHRAIFRETLGARRYAGGATQ